MCQACDYNALEKKIIRIYFPGFGNRSWRRWLAGKTMRHLIVEVDPYRTPWIQPGPSVVTMWKDLT